MRIINRYLATEFLKPLLFVVFAFLCVILVSEFFDKLDIFIKYKAAMPAAFKYFLWRTPEWLVYIMPLSILLATLFSLSGLSGNNEISAMKASGISFTQLCAPLFIIGLLCVAFTIWFNEMVVPYSNEKASYVYNVEIKGQKVREYTTQYNVVITGLDNRKYTIGSVDTKKKLLKNITLDELSPGLILSRQLLSETAEWKDELPLRKEKTGKKSYRWILKNGIIRQFDSSGRKVTGEEKFYTKDTKATYTQMAKTNRSHSRNTTANFKRSDKLLLQILSLENK